MITPYHLFANKLDPRCLGRRLSDVEDENVMNFASEKYSFIIPNLMNFSAKSVFNREFLFSKSTIDNILPCDW